MTRNATSAERLNDEVKTAEGLRYLENASDGYEMIVVVNGWIRFRACEEVLHGRWFSLKMKGKMYQICIRSAILYGGEHGV